VNIGKASTKMPSIVGSCTLIFPQNLIVLVNNISTPTKLAMELGLILLVPATTLPCMNSQNKGYVLDPATVIKCSHKTLIFL
jgi:hypothetical protein